MLVFVMVVVLVVCDDNSVGSCDDRSVGSLW